MATLAQSYMTGSKASSAYERLRRFVCEISFDSRKLAVIIASLSGLPDTPWVLSLDRTNWKFGKRHINLLVLSACSSSGSAAVPLFWMQLDDKRQGNSDHIDRLDLLEMFCQVFGKEKIIAITGDREFIGEHWFGWMQQQGIGFVMRIKENGTYIANSRGKMMLASELLRNLNVHEVVSLGKRKVTKSDRQKLCLSATRNAKGDILLVAHSENLENPIELYIKRWQIEVLFKCCKGNGFDLESTHVTAPDRIETMVGVMAIAFAVAYAFGIWHHANHPPKTKKHGYIAKSVFRQGLHILQYIITNQQQKMFSLNKIATDLFGRRGKIKCFVG
jgi:Transposase DDE domain